jgi:glycosyltransferase involved in cell wall biosynthesis
MAEIYNNDVILPPWADGLVNLLLTKKKYDITVAFPYFSSHLKKINSNTHINYLPFKMRNGFLKKPSKKEKKNIFDIISNHAPDVIHVFGTEYNYTNTIIEYCTQFHCIDKLIIQIQGMISAISKHYYDGLPNYLVHNFTLRDLLKIDNIFIQKNKFNQRGINEVNSIKKSKYIIGRTDFDNAITKRINPRANYFYCSEVLRDSFYHGSWDSNKCIKNSIFISQIDYPVKGTHYLLEALEELIIKYPDLKVFVTGPNFLKNSSVIDLIKETSYTKYLRKSIIKKGLDKCFVFLGKLNGKQMKEAYLKANVYVNCSNIENSSNSISEALILGVPTIASFVGGSSNLITHKSDGMLYQHNAPYMLSYFIDLLFSNSNLANSISNKAIINSKNRHDKDIIYNTINTIYEGIMKKNEKL